MDPIRFRRRMISHVVQSPVIAVPAVAGALVMAVAMLFGQPAGFLTFLGASGLFFAAGMAVTRLVWGTPDVAEAVHEDCIKSLEGGHEEYLDRLQEKLSRDEDERTDVSLTKLRRLHKRLHRDGLLNASVDAIFYLEIRDKVEQLYLSCLTTLERTFEFWRTAAEMATTEARQEVLRQREQLISEVDSSVGHLEATVDQLQAKQLQNGSGERELQQVRQELDMGLQVARQVEARLTEFEEGLGASPETLRE